MMMMTTLITAMVMIMMMFISGDVDSDDNESIAFSAKSNAPNNLLKIISKRKQQLRSHLLSI